MLNSKKDVLNRKPMRIRLSITQAKLYYAMDRAYHTSCYPGEMWDREWYKSAFRNYIAMNGRYGIMNKNFINKFKSFNLAK